MSAQFDKLINGYIQNKAGICPDFLSHELVAELRKNLEVLNQRDELSPAGTGLGVSKIYDLQIRSDKIYWIDKTSTNPYELEFLDQVEAFISYLNQTCYTGINDFEFHYAIYEAGSFYKRHLDQFKNNNGRKFSFINYLNEDWQDSDGGHLVIYPDDKTDKITPIGGTSVFFKSDELEHEVNPANRTRMSITGWLKRV